MATRRRKTWREKLADDKNLPKVEPIAEGMRKSWGEGTFVIAAPREVDALMRQVPPGQLTTINQLREALARRHGATVACPITTGIFAWVAAHAAEETLAAEPGATVTPWWRTLKLGGRLNPKYPGGTAEQARRLQAEGHRITVGRGKDSLRVAEFESHLAALS